MLKKDLFEELAALCGCEYISDMRFEPYNETAKRNARNLIRAEDYSLRELSDLYEYLYGEKIEFCDYSEIKKAFTLYK